MTSRIDKANVAFARVYDEKLWGLDRQPPQHEVMERIANLIKDTIRKYNIKSVAEFGCGFWNYAKLVDWTGLTYDGYDVSHHPINFNADAYTAPNIHFHHLVDEAQLAPADLLISKDVFQHLPNEDVLHYLAKFKTLFSYMLILNISFPDDNLNGPIDHGGSRALRLDLAPFNEPLEVIDEWDNPLFGVPYHELACLLRGERTQPVSVTTWAKKFVKRILP